MIRLFFKRLGCLFGRYDVEGEIIHRSRTSVLKFATDISGDEGIPVALKFMQVTHLKHLPKSSRNPSPGCRVATPWKRK